MKTQILIVLFALIAFTGCTTVNHPTIGSSDVANKLGVANCEIERGIELSYVNFCTTKDCDGSKLKYTKVFRETAILTKSIGELDRLALKAALQHHGPNEVINAGNEELPVLRSELNALSKKFQKLNPAIDFADESERAHARTALEQARKQIRDSKVRLVRAETNIGTILGPDEVVHVAWQDDAGEHLDVDSEYVFEIPEFQMLRRGATSTTKPNTINAVHKPASAQN